MSSARLLGRQTNEGRTLLEGNWNSLGNGGTLVGQRELSPVLSEESESEALTFPDCKMKAEVD
jgi:hypothetical protein